MIPGVPDTDPLSVGILCGILNDIERDVIDPHHKRMIRLAGGTMHRSISIPVHSKSIALLCDALESVGHESTDPYHRRIIELSIKTLKLQSMESRG